jgi:predicted nucleic acid-binding protein
VILLDANILIYSYDSGSSQHTKARAWVEKTFSGLESVGTIVANGGLHSCES